MTLFHSVPGFLFMTLGPLQFMSSIRKRWIHLHRMSGRIYLGVCTLVAIGAISIGFAFPIWGWTLNQWGTLGYSLLLLFFVFKAYRHIRVSNWVAQADRDEGKRKDGLTSIEREEVATHRRLGHGQFLERLWIHR